MAVGGGRRHLTETAVADRVLADSSTTASLDATRNAVLGDRWEGGGCAVWCDREDAPSGTGHTAKSHGVNHPGIRAGSDPWK